MTFGEAQTEFYARGFDYLSESTAGQTRAKRWINEAYKEVCAEEPWPFLETTATGAAPLAVSSVDAVLSVVDTTNNNQLKGVDRRTLVAWFTDLTTTGTADYWYLDDTTIRVYPVSTASLSVRYTQIPSDRSADADTFLIPTRFQRMIIDRAVIDAYWDNDEAASAKELEGRYQQDLLRMLKAYSRQLDGPAVIISDAKNY